MYKFKLVAVAGHAVASATVKFNHFSGKNTVMSRRVLQPVRSSELPPRSCSGKSRTDGAPKATSKGRQAVKAGKGVRELKWRWDNTPAEMKKLEKLRWAGHGWSGAKARVRTVLVSSMHTAVS